MSSEYLFMICPCNMSGYFCFTVLIQPRPRWSQERRLCGAFLVRQSSSWPNRHSRGGRREKELKFDWQISRSYFDLTTTYVMPSCQKGESCASSE